MRGECRDLEVGEGLTANENASLNCTAVDDFAGEGRYRYCRSGEGSAADEDTVAAGDDAGVADAAGKSSISSKMRCRRRSRQPRYQPGHREHYRCW